MSRKLVLALFAFLSAVVTAWADPGGDGGCVNLPGGRTGERPSSGGSAWETTVAARDGVRFRLPEELAGAVAFVSANDLPFTQILPAKDGVVHVSSAMLETLWNAGETGFTMRLVDELGVQMVVHVTLKGPGELIVTVP